MSNDINSIDRDAIGKFLSPHEKGFLTLKNGEIHFVSTLEMGTVEKIKSSFNKTSFKKISLYVRQNQETLFPASPEGKTRKLQFNNAIVQFNKKEFVYKEVLRLINN